MRCWLEEGIGRAYWKMGDLNKAAAEYVKFLEYWKDADANHPELADARKRLHAVQSSGKSP